MIPVHATAVSKDFGEFTAVDRTDLDVRAGEVVGLLGTVRERLGTSVLLVTHNPRDAAFADVVHFLVDGQLNAEHVLRGPNIEVDRVHETLAALREQGVRLAILSGSIDLVLNHFFAEGTFDEDTSRGRFEINITQNKITAFFSKSQSYSLAITYLTSRTCNNRHFIFQL